MSLRLTVLPTPGPSAAAAAADWLVVAVCFSGSVVRCIPALPPAMPAVPFCHLSSACVWCCPALPVVLCSVRPGDVPLLTGGGCNSASALVTRVLCWFRCECSVCHIALYLATALAEDRGPPLHHHPCTSSCTIESSLRALSPPSPIRYSDLTASATPPRQSHRLAA